jgi:hypothetical protein
MQQAIDSGGWDLGANFNAAGVLDTIGTLGKSYFDYKSAKVESLGRSYVEGQTAPPVAAASGGLQIGGLQIGSGVLLIGLAALLYLALK